MLILILNCGGNYFFFQISKKKSILNHGLRSYDDDKVETVNDKKRYISTWDFREHGQMSNSGSFFNAPWDFWPNLSQCYRFNSYWSKVMEN